ncbi:MAG TPA: NAD(P)H-binding protein, partial [Hyphomicrobiaceae bacterium]|nr:NAD(P)H-binding protein [Hyphomicrobiaceae bacterium]
MKVIVVGATGLIGSATTATLRSQGHEVIGIARRVPHGLTAPGMTWIASDLQAMVRPADWRPYLKGVDAVVYSAGTLQDEPGDSTAAVHDDAVSALAEACQACGVRRFVHLSAIGVDRETPTEFSRSKSTGDA